MDYRKFLNQQSSEVLPYLGGPTVDSLQRRLRVTAEVDPGWWRFDVAGRSATPSEPCEPPDLSHLKQLRGHLAGAWLFQSGSECARLQLMPQEEPPALSPCRGRQWADLLLFEGLDWEQEAEATARDALVSGQSIADLKGAAPSLRAAFGFALLARVSQRLGIPVSPHEVLPSLRAVADRGRPAATELLQELAQRRQDLRALRAVTSPQARHRRRRHNASPEQVAERALDKAGARLRATRRLDGGLIEVSFWFMSEVFVAVVHNDSLQVLDAGICLSGRDELVNLESLPSVIREAIERGELCITRHGY